MAGDYTKTGEAFLRRLARHISDIFCCNYKKEDWCQAEHKTWDRMESIMKSYKANEICELEAARELMQLVDGLLD